MRNSTHKIELYENEYFSCRTNSFEMDTTNFILSSLSLMEGNLIYFRKSVGGKY